MKLTQEVMDRRSRMKRADEIEERDCSGDEQCNDDFAVGDVDGYTEAENISEYDHDDGHNDEPNQQQDDESDRQLTSKNKPNRQQVMSQLIDWLQLAYNLFDQSINRIIWNLFLAFIPLIFSFQN